MAQQANWRFCQGCHAMFFAGYQGGRCPTGSPHGAQGVNFILPYDVPGGPNAQQGWRFCVKCNTMFYERGGGGVCPVGGSHSGQGIDSFALPCNVASAPGAQGDWHRCVKCNAMFFGGFGGGQCPAGDKHAADGNNFVLPYNMDGYLVWQSETISDPSKYFVSKSDPASLAGRGAKTANGRVWRQELALGGRADIGITGVTSWKTISLGLSNVTIASVMTFAGLGEYSAGPDGIRLVFQISGIAGGSAMLVAYENGRAFASMQIYVTGAVAAEAGYVDDFQDFAYDPTYKAENGNRSTIIAVRYYDDVVVPIDYRTISDGTLVPETQLRRIGAGGRLYPLVLNAVTTPKLHAAKRQVYEILDAMLYDDVRFQLLKATVEMAFYVSLFQLGVGMGGPISMVARKGVGSLLRKVADLPDVLRAFFAANKTDGEEITEASVRAAEVGQATVRQRASTALLRKMLENPQEYYLWGTNDADAAANKTIVFTGETNQTATKGIYLTRGSRHAFVNPAYGKYQVVIEADKFRISRLPGQPAEHAIILEGDGGIAATDGVWYSAEDIQAAQAGQ